LLKEFKVSYAAAIPPSLFSNRRVPALHEVPIQAEYAYKALSTTFAKGDVDGMLPSCSPWAQALLKSWQRHCKENNLAWSLEVDGLVNSAGLGAQYLAVKKSDDRNQIAAQVKERLKDPSLFSEIRKATSSEYRLFGVYFVHFVVKESWKLIRGSDDGVIFVSPEHHPNHHIWKFGVEIPPKDSKEELNWVVLDFDDLVRRRVRSIRSAEEALGLPNVDPVTVFQHYCL
jgi:hypothetical protein